MKKRPSKFGNRKTVYNGDTYDSKAEAEYARQLDEQGIDYTRQPDFILVPAYTLEGKKVRSVSYRADFLIRHEDGTQEVVDVKGAETEAFKLKWKLLGWAASKGELGQVRLTKVPANSIKPRRVKKDVRPKPEREEPTSRTRSARPKQERMSAEEYRRRYMGDGS